MSVQSGENSPDQFLDLKTECDSM